MLFEPIPYRLAVREGATHVLVLRTRPDGVNVVRRQSIFERLIAWRFFERKMRMPHMYKHMRDQQHRQRYAEDILLLNEAAKQSQADSGIHIRWRSGPGPPEPVQLCQVALQPGERGPEVSNLQTDAGVTRSGRDRAEIGPRCVAEISPRDQTYPRDSPWYSRRPTDEVAAPAQSASPLPPQRPTRRRFQGRSSTPSAAALRVRSRRAESCLAPPRPVSPSSSALPSAGARPARPRGRLSSRRLAARPGGLPRLDPRGGARVDGEAQAEANVSGVERGATLIARDKPRAHAERPEGGRDQRSTCIRAGGADWMAGASRRGTAVA